MMVAVPEDLLCWVLNGEVTPKGSNCFSEGNEQRLGEEREVLVTVNVTAYSGASTSD